MKYKAKITLIKPEGNRTMTMPVKDTGKSISEIKEYIESILKTRLKNLKYTKIEIL